ncbi:hypothetical protein BJX76DRAFT_354004 [Aspergillus varians]
MSGENTPPHSPSQAVAGPTVDGDTFINTVKHIVSLASSPELKIASAIVNEIESQREQLKEREHELTKLRERMLDQEKHKTIAVNEMFAAMEKEKANVRRAEGEKEVLQKSVTGKDKALAEKAQKIKALQTQFDTLRSKCSNETAKVVQASKDISELQERLKKGNETINELKKAESSAKSQLSDQKTKTDALEKETISMRAAMEKNRTQLEKIVSFQINPLTADEDSMMDEFSNLWDYATAEISAVLTQDLDNALLKDKPRWEKLRKNNHNIPLLASNTPAAKGLRLALLLGILSREIDKYIFQPNYLTSEPTEMRNILSQLASTDGEKEAFCRSILLSVGQNAQQESLKSRIQSVVENVSSCMCPLLSEMQNVELRRHIGNVVKRAIEVWRPIQCAQSKYEPDFEPLNWDDNEWVAFNFPSQDAGSSKTDEETPSVNLLTIFPRISYVEDHRRHPLTFVIQLRKSHPLCVMADQEMVRKPTSPTSGRKPQNGVRRRSISGNAPIANGKPVVPKIGTGA